MRTEKNSRKRLPEIRAKYCVNHRIQGRIEVAEPEEEAR